jgi:hypothetical protein
MSISFVAIDSTAASSASSLTYERIIAAGSDIWLVVGAGTEGGVADSNAIVSDVTFDSVTLSAGKIVADPNAGRMHTEIWGGLVTAKTADVVVTWVGTPSHVGSAAADYTGADDFDATNSLEVDGSTDINISLTTLNDNSYVVEFASNRSTGAWVEDSSQNSRAEFDGSGTGYGFWDILKVTAGAQAMDLTGQGTRTGVCVAELKEKAGGIIAVGAVAEDELLAAVQIDLSLPVGAVSESEELFPVAVDQGQIVNVGAVSESESLAALQIDLSLPVGAVSESESLAAVVAELIVSIGAVNESESLAAVVADMLAPVGALNEIEALFAVSSGDVIAVGALVESETLAVIQIDMAVPVGAVNESETLAAVTAVTLVPAGVVNESETLAGIVADLILPVGALNESEILAAVIVGVATLTGPYFAMEVFTSGQGDVTVEIYDPLTGLIVSIDDAGCIELGSSGIYAWDTKNLTTQPTGFKMYGFRMTDDAGATFKGGQMFVADAEDTVKLADLFKRLDLDTTDQNTYNDDGSLIVNDEFTLTKTDNGDGTFDIIRTPT